MDNSSSQNDNNYDLEWKRSLESIDLFDKILIDLRKTGFTILTGLTAAGTVFQLGLDIQTGIIHATSILVILLFWLDLYYQNVLTGVLLRAHFLEIFRLKRGITYFVTSMYNKAKLQRYTNAAYIGFFAALLVLGYVVQSDIAKEENNIEKLKYESLEKNSSSSIELSIDSSKIFNIPEPLPDNSNYLEIMIKDFTSIPNRIFQSELSRASLLFLIAEIASIIYLAYESRNKRRFINTILKIYNYFLRVQIKSETTVNELEKIIMKIMSSNIEDEIISRDNYTLYDISNTIPYKKHITKLFLIPKIQYRFWGIGPEMTTIFWIFVSKIGILIVEPKYSKQSKIISKYNLYMEEGDNLSKITERLKTYSIIEEITSNTDEIKMIAKEFYFFLR